jgi:hypothetical protein
LSLTIFVLGYWVGVDIFLFKVYLVVLLKCWNKMHCSPSHG